MAQPDREEEVVDALPVLAEPVDPPLADRPSGGSLVVTPERQAAVVAAASFVAGAATVAVLRRRKGRRALPGRRRNGRKGELVRVTGSRSFLVDVHLLERG